MNGQDRLRDEALVRRYLADPEGAAGKEAAAELLEAYRERVYLWCYRRVRDHETALDLAQDVLISAFRGLLSFQGRSGFSCWLFVIARNRCLSVLRRPSLLRDESADPGDLASDAPDPERLLEERLDEEEILELLRSRLDPLEQRALWLRCIEGMPVEEITALLEVPDASGARAVLQRARRKLRAALDEIRPDTGRTRDS